MSHSGKQVGTQAAHSLLHWLSRHGAKQFKKATHDMVRAQERVLFTILRANESSRFGKALSFRKIKSVETFRKIVPVSSYEDYLPYIELIRNGTDKVLTVDPVIRLEPSSGTTSGTKFIPYTKNLTSDFQKGIAPWLNNLYSAYPALKRGTHYWAVTPVAMAEHDYPVSSVTIGFMEDAEYFGPIEKHVIRRTMAVPAILSSVRDIESCRYLTLRLLLADENLAFISIWNPTFLSLLLNAVEPWIPSLLQDIHQGTIHPPGEVAEQVHSKLVPFIKPAPERASQIERILSRWQNSKQQPPWETIWPKLTLISCWADAWAHPYADALKTQFPNTAIQGKGLMATEAFVSFPLIGIQVPGNVLSLNSHFFEFECALDGDLYLAHQLQTDHDYNVIITTSGGLYRYRLGDRVRVTGIYNQVPILKFLGKSDLVSDLFGEKLHEAHVSTCVEQTFREFGWTTKAAYLTPELENGPPHYVLHVCTEEESMDINLLAEQLDKKLSDNFHYAYCRKLGQLACAQVKLISMESNTLNPPHSNGHLSTVKTSVLVPKSKVAS